MTIATTSNVPESLEGRGNVPITSRDRRMTASFFVAHRKGKKGHAAVLGLNKAKIGA
jgi:hypothetical protein